MTEQAQSQVWQSGRTAHSRTRNTPRRLLITLAEWSWRLPGTGRRSRPWAGLRHPACDGPRPTGWARGPEAVTPTLPRVRAASRPSRVRSAIRPRSPGRTCGRLPELDRQGAENCGGRIRSTNVSQNGTEGPWDLAIQGSRMGGRGHCATVRSRGGQLLIARTAPAGLAVLRSPHPFDESLSTVSVSHGAAGKSETRYRNSNRGLSLSAPEQVVAQGLAS
jgi:hypothetical protein